MERKRDLRRVCVKSRVRFLREVQTFRNGELLLEHCEKFGFEGRGLEAPGGALR